MIKYYLRFAIHSYSKLRVLNSILYALADQNMFTATIRTIWNEILKQTRISMTKKLVTMYQQCIDTFEL